MDQSFRLLDEDRADYAAALDEIIGSAEIRELLPRSRVGAGQLRIKGLAATPRVARAAEAEYRAYTELRQQKRDDEQTGRAAPLSGPGRQERTGAGLVPVLAVLTPVLAAAAAVTFLLLGYVLRLADSSSATADTLAGAGWISLGTAALTGVVGLLALYRTAAEHKQSAASSHSEPSADLARARETWLKALREGGVRPFLVAQLEAEPVRPGPSSAHHPRFSSPDFGSPDFARPAYGHPDFSSPDFGGPDTTEPEANKPDFASPAYARPAYGHPDFSSPDFGGPDTTEPEPSKPDFAGPAHGHPGFSGPGLPGSRG